VKPIKKEAKFHQKQPFTNIAFEERIADQLPAWHDRLNQLLGQFGSVPIGEVTVAKAYGGMRGVFALITEISHVDPNMGLLIRGYTIDELLEKLPKVEGDVYPLVGGLYYLLLVDDFPTLKDALDVENMWRDRQDLPAHVIDLLRAMPENSHPMTLLSQAILALQPSSEAARAYHEGISRHDYWRPMLEDALNLTAKLPTLAAMIYNIKYRGGMIVEPDPDLDWSANFAYMIGKGNDDEYKELCRLFMTIHADQENGNASAHTAHLVGSTLSDLYLSCSAGLNALAGPLHGLASQETLRWLIALRTRYGGLPSHEDLAQFALETINAGKVIPGYGHGVLRRTDSRFTAQFRFAERYLPDDLLFNLVNRVYEVIPQVLQSTGKVNNPFPNVDAISAVLQYHYGITQPEFSTVLFGTSRLLGLSAHAVWARALGLSIERPRSLTTSLVEELVMPPISLPKNLSALVPEGDKSYD
jgi:citrate synthase